MSPPSKEQEAPAFTERLPLINIEETTVKENIISTSAVRSILASGVGSDASASRSLFGLPKSDKKIGSSSLFGFVPPSAPAQAMTGSPLRVGTLEVSATDNQTTSSWFSTLRPPNLNTHAVNNTSLFSLLPKTTISGDFSFSKTTETKAPTDKGTNTQSNRSATIKTSGASDKHKQQNQLQSQKDLSNVASVHSKHQIIFKHHRPLLSRPTLNSQVQKGIKSSQPLTGSKLFSNLTAGLMAPKNIADNKVNTNPTLNTAARERYKPVPQSTKQDSTIGHDQESTEPTSPLEALAARKANPLQSRDTPSASIFSKKTTATSKFVPPAFILKTKSSLPTSNGNAQGERQGFMQLHRTSK
ncbi:hypothetical protein QM012_005386 [Aureobasidium pullulans]|uniref:Uncharacterized protein n=1 Tax=Aureobasidium pullulans TaxID=5580 RepID=A0ABR0T4Y7_AURPU